MLEGRQFILFTDCKPLTQVLFRTSDLWTPRQCKQLNYIAEHIRPIARLDIVVADMLSCSLLSLAPSAEPMFLHSLLFPSSPFKYLPGSFHTFMWTWEDPFL
jgi:hypothetical protein